MNLNIKEKQSLKSNEESLDNHKEEQLLINSVQSEYAEAYETFMAGVQIADLETIKKKLMNNEIEFILKFHPQTEIKLIEIDLDSAKLEITLGNFRTCLTIYRIILNEDEILEQNYLLGFGSYATVCKINVEGEYFACKSVKVIESKNLFSLVHVYEEYLFTKISGALGIGPRIQRAFHYDIICFKNRALFTMELCVTDLTIFSSAIARENLLNGLKLLHFLKICHGDIKLENVGYSSNNDRYVFIDFGLSRVVKANIGQKSLTSFFGTFQYASPQMKKNYFLRKSAAVDLFYNDIHCLNCFFMRLGNLKNYGQQKYSMKIPYCSASTMFSIRYSLFRGQAQMALETIKECTNFPKSTLKIFIEQFCIRRNSSENQRNKILQMLKNRIGDDPDFFNMLDEVFSIYFQKLYNQQFDNCFINIINYIESDLSLELIWSKKYWMDEILLFLKAELRNQHKGWTKKDFILRAKLIEKIFECLKKKCSLIEQNLSFLFRFRTVMSALLQYYQKQQNIRMLEIVRDLCIKIDDFPSQYRAQSALLSLYIKQGRERNYLAAKKIEFFLFRKLQNDFFYYPAQEILIVNGSLNQHFFQFDDDMNPLQILYYKLVNFKNPKNEDKQKISQIFNAAKASETDPEYRKLISDFQVLYNSKLSLTFLKKNYKSVQNKRIKLVLKKMFCFHWAELYAFTLFNQDLYLSHLKSYLEVFKSIFHFTTPRIIEVINQYFSLYYAQLQFFPEQYQFINVLRKQKDEQVIFSAFTDTFISYYKASTLSTTTFILENIKIVNEIVLFFMMKFSYFTPQCHLQLKHILEECQSKLKGVEIGEINEKIIKFVEILLVNFWDKKMMAEHLLLLVKSIEVEKIVNTTAFHSMVQIMAALWTCETAVHHELENTIIYIQRSCMEIGSFSLFEDFKVTFNVLQQILVKRNCCELEFRFYIAISKIVNRKRKKYGHYFLSKANDRFHYFVASYSSENLLKTAPIMCEGGRIKLMLEREHLGGLYFEIYLKIEKLLSFEMKKKLLIIIAFGIPNIIWISKRDLIIPIFYKKQMKVFEGKSARKTRICLRIRRKYENFKPDLETKAVEKIRAGMQKRLF